MFKQIPQTLFCYRLYIYNIFMDKDLARHPGASDKSSPGNNRTNDLSSKIPKFATNFSQIYLQLKELK